MEILQVTGKSFWDSLMKTENFRLNPIKDEKDKNEKPTGILKVDDMEFFIEII